MLILYNTAFVLPLVVIVKVLVSAPTEQVTDATRSAARRRE